MTSFSLTGSDSQFQSQDPGPYYSDDPDTVAAYDDEEDYIEDEDELYEYLTNHYFRAGHDGCDEYTNLTTFHGMIRVFNSRNCPSLIFWCLVVTTCLVFYMMVCGTMIKSYSQQPSFMRINETTDHRFENDIDVCSKEQLLCNNIIVEEGELTCREADMHCLSIRFSTKVKIRLKNQELHFKHGTEKDIFHLLSDDHTHHRIQLKVFQIERLDLERAPCFGSYNEVLWIPKDMMPNKNYTLTGCERLRFKMTGQVVDQQKSFPCQPACFEQYYQASYSYSRHHFPTVGITFTVLPTVTYMIETRKTTLVDILCFLGGASSLFMGCSCVTLMEMFVFLFKLVTNSVWSKEAPEPDDSFYQEKFEFEYSDHRNKRRYAICNRETMEKYLLKETSVDIRSINLDKRISVFSHSAIKKAPKLMALKDNRNFDNVDIFDAGDQPQSVKGGPSSSTKDEFSVDYQDEKLDTLGEPYIPPETKLLRPPLRRASTATSFASHTSKGSSGLTVRSFTPITHNRRQSRAFSRNMPMNDF